MKHHSLFKTRKQSILLRLLCFVIWVAMIMLGATPVQITATFSSLSYDLLFLSGPVTYDPQNTSWTNLDRGTLSLNIFDAQTGEFTQIETTDMPLNQEALSPDGQYLAVYRDSQVCLVDRYWQTVFCLAPDSVELRGRRWFSYCDGCMVYWEADSQSFWAVSRLSEPELVQISVPEGEVLRSLEVENPLERATEVQFITIYPVGRRFLVGYDWSCCYLFDLDTGDFLYKQEIDWGLSPDAQLVESGGQGWLGSIFRLEPHPVWLNDAIPITVAQINPHSAWSNTPELAWAEGDPRWNDLIVRIWSHDSRKIAFHRSIVQEGRGDVGFAGVYFLDTREVRILGQDSWELADLYWSPDDSAVAVLPTNTGYPAHSGKELTILTLDGSTIPVLSEEELFSVYSITWLPHGWLQLDQ